MKKIGLSGRGDTLIAQYAHPEGWGSEASSLYICRRGAAVHSTTMRGDEKLKCHVRLESLSQANLSGLAQSSPYQTAISWYNHVCYGLCTNQHERQDNLAFTKITMCWNVLEYTVYTLYSFKHRTKGPGNSKKIHDNNLVSGCFILLFWSSLLPLLSHLCHSSDESVSPVLRALTVNPGAPGYATDGHKL